MDYNSDKAVFDTPIIAKWEDLDEGVRKEYQQMYDNGQMYLMRYINGQTILDTLERINKYDMIQPMPIGHAPNQTVIPYHEGFWRNTHYFLQRYYHMFQTPVSQQINWDNDENPMLMYDLFNAAYFADNHLQKVFEKEGKLPPMSEWTGGQFY